MSRLQDREDRKESKKEGVLKESTRDPRFLNFVESWVKRFKDRTREEILIGEDVVIEFDSMAIHPVTRKGMAFLAFMQAGLRVK